MNRGAWWATVHGVAESDTTEQITLGSLHTDYLLVTLKKYSNYDGGKIEQYLDRDQNTRNKSQIKQFESCLIQATTVPHEEMVVSGSQWLEGKKKKILDILPDVTHVRADQLTPNAHQNSQSSDLRGKKIQ